MKVVLGSLKNGVDHFFLLSRNGTEIPTEIRAGVVTFLTSSYIIFIQPAVLSETGMDFGTLVTATCISAALGCMVMGLIGVLFLVRYVMLSG